MASTSSYKVKHIIQSEISKPDIHSEVQDIFDSHSIHGNASGPPNQQKLMEMLKSKGIADKILANVLKQMDLSTAKVEYEPTDFTGVRMAPPSKDGCYLFVELIQGHAFIDHILDSDNRPMAKHGIKQPSSKMCFHLSLDSQRWQSKWISSTSDPAIQETACFQLLKQNANHVTLTSLLTQSHCGQLHLVAVSHDSHRGENKLLSSHYFDWRVVLNSPGGVTKLNMELKGIGPEAKVSIGVLEVRLTLLPRPIEVLDNDLVSGQMALERSRQAERERIFLVYAKQWWKEYIQIRDSHSQRLVKIFASDENGENRFVCSYVHPLQAGRILESPRQCARFVSSISFERISILGSGPKEQWASAQAFLARNKGDVEEHACLLCSLLLGFGLEAFVAIGTRVTVDAPYAWVVTLQHNTEPGSAVFWDAVNGRRYIHRPYRPDRFPIELPPKSDSKTCPYRTIATLFNHEKFYANNQPTDAVETCVFTLKDESRWKCMSRDAIVSLRELEETSKASSPALRYLRPPQIACAAMSEDLELELRQCVTDWRRNNGGLTVRWNEPLSHILSQALWAYECEQLHGARELTVDNTSLMTSFGNEEFQTAVRLSVPDGHTFKAYPIQVLHTNAQRAFHSAMRSSMCQDIVNCRGDLMQLALRVRVYCYAESAVATWIMIACTYKSVP